MTEKRPDPPKFVEFKEFGATGYRCTGCGAVFKADVFTSAEFQRWDLETKMSGHFCPRKLNLGYDK